MTNPTIKNNKAGDLYKVDLQETTVLNIFTRAGNYRGGKSYSVDKFFTVLTGSLELTMNIGGTDEESIHHPGELVTIPAQTPSIFYFPEDTEILEWFASEHETEKFEEYYNLKK